jgi:hypothetical protein
VFSVQARLPIEHVTIEGQSTDVVGVAVGGFTDPTFPPPMISGFEAYGPAWAMNASDLPMPHYDYDGTSHGGPRA